MEIYDCKVLLGGSRDNEVRKRAIPAAEVLLLKHLHGDDHVLELIHVGTCDITDAQVRDMMALSYAPDYGDSKVTPPLMRDVFGPPSIPLMPSIEGVKLRAKARNIAVADVTRWRETRFIPNNAPINNEPSFAD